MDYCNGLLFTIPSTELDRVQRLQRKKHLNYSCLFSKYPPSQYLDTCLNLYTPARALRSAGDPLRITY